MEKMAIRAEYQTENVFNTGHIFVYGDKAEGLFTLDYVDLETKGDVINFIVYEKTYFKKNGKTMERTTRKIYESEPLGELLKNVNKPILLHNKYDTMHLYLHDLERDKLKVEKLYNKMVSMRPKKRYFFN